MVVHYCTVHCRAMLLQYSKIVKSISVKSITVQYSTLQSVHYSTVQYSTVHYSTPNRVVSRALITVIDYEYTKIVYTKTGHIVQCIPFGSRRLGDSSTVRLLQQLLCSKHVHKQPGDWGGCQKNYSTYSRLLLVHWYVGQRRPAVLLLLYSTLEL